MKIFEFLNLLKLPAWIPQGHHKITIKDLWYKTLNADLTPIFEAVTSTVSIVSIIVVVILGGIAWWLRRHTR